MHWARSGPQENASAHGYHIVRMKGHIQVPNCAEIAKSLHGCLHEHEFEHLHISIWQFPTAHMHYEDQLQAQKTIAKQSCRVQCHHVWLSGFEPNHLK